MPAPVFTTPPTLPILGSATFGADVNNFVAYWLTLRSEMNDAIAFIGAISSVPTGDAVNVTDYDAITSSGAYRNNTVSATGAPTTGASYSVLHINQSANLATQWAQRPTGPLFIRMRSGGVWGAWDTVFSRSNILGTVSQASGVPTGAIIERGSNANGEYVRYADGTQICIYSALSAANASTALGSLFRSANVAWTFPAAFVSTTGLVVTGNADDADSWVAANGLTTTTVNLRVIAGVTKASAINVRGMAVGRWF